MKKYLLWFSAVFCLLTSYAQSGQSTFLPGFKYQAVLRDANGTPLSNQSLELKVSIRGSAEIQENFYAEFHHVQTNQQGLFELIIGGGEQKSGALSTLPWGAEQLWLQLEMAQDGLANYSLVSKSPLMAVPYALHAANASSIYDPSVVDETLEKAQSIYWHTSGNSGTNPNVHFIGSRDNVNVVFKTNGIAYLTLTPIGKLQLISDVPAGPDNLKSSYPMIVEGTNNTQGVWVEINGSRKKANNFVTFADDFGIQGRIEGQTLSELEASDSYKTMVEVTSLNSVALASKIVELGVKCFAEATSAALAAVVCGATFGIIACSDVPANLAGSVACGVKLSAWVIELATYLTVTGTSYDRIRSKVGVSFSSGSGDYAEWLLRKPGERDLIYGEIVGVNGGVVSRTTDLASRNMVVSQYPAFLGKTPAEGTEDNYEKIAFMGQVPVRVIGKVKSGDYILPSGKNDGLGIAVHPDELAIADYEKIVGVAWETVDNGAPINLVNVAVGLKSNQLAGKVDEIEQKVNNIIDFLEGKDALHPDGKATDASIFSTDVVLPSPNSTDNLTLDGKRMSDQEFDLMIDQSAEYIHSMFASIENTMKAQGQDISHPAIVALLKDPVNTLKMMHRNPNEFVQKAMSKR